MFCERCGQQFLKSDSLCTRCQFAPTKQWLQLAGLGMLSVAFAASALSGSPLPPHVAAAGRHRLFHVWHWLTNAASLYGWAVAALGLLGWSFLVRRDDRLQKKEWVARTLLILLLLGGAAAPIFFHLPARIVPEFRATARSYAAWGPPAAWAMIVLVIVPLCMNTETRDSLLGNGRGLSLAGFGVMLLVTAILLGAW